MNKKIIIIISIILIVILVGLGIYFLFFKRVEEINFLNKSELPKPVGFSGLETPEVSLPSDVEIGDLSLEGLNVGLSLPNNLFSNIPADTSGIGVYGEKIDIQKPAVSFDISPILNSLDFSSKSQPSEPQSPKPEINEENCSQFKSAPSCSFVPQQRRSLCEQCKAAGY